MPDEQLVPVSGGERVPLFKRETRDGAARGDVELEPGPPGAPPRPSSQLAVASVHVWPSLHCLMPGRSHTDIPDIMDTGKVEPLLPSTSLCSLRLTDRRATTPPPPSRHTSAVYPSTRARWTLHLA